MDNMVLPDYFGHKTEAEFLDWAVGQFNEHAYVTVTDKSEMAFTFELGEQDGCCEMCYTEDARVEVKYDYTVLIFSGYYSYENNYADLVLTLSETVEVKRM